MQTEIFTERASPPTSLPGIGHDSRAGKVWRILLAAHPGWVNLTTLERVAFTKVTNRISDIRKVSRPLGWDTVNRTEHIDGIVYSWYSIQEWKGDRS